MKRLRDLNHGGFRDTCSEEREKAERVESVESVESVWSVRSGQSLNWEAESCMRE